MTNRDTDTPIPPVALSVAALTLGVAVTRDIHWNSFPGSVIHGIYGMSVKEHTCVVAHRNCRKCHLLPSCPYGVIFESPVPAASARMRLYPQTPHPIRILVHPWDQTVIASGQSFTVSLTLFGEAGNHVLTSILSLEEALARGIGRRHEGDRGRARIEYLLNPVTGERWAWEDLRADYRPVVRSRPIRELLPQSQRSAFQIVLNAPMRIVTEGRINFNPTLRDFVSNALRRIANLHYFFGGAEWEADFAGIIESSNCASVTPRLRKVPAQRYSSRQKTTISLSGIVGVVDVRDCPPPVEQVLRIGQYLGLGKGTTFGLGDYSVAQISDS